MARLLLAFAAAALVASRASAQTLLSDNFNAENGGNSALNYSGFANWNVTGQVDLVRSGDFGITCAGGSGSCVDLDGSSGPGDLRTKSTFSFVSGDRVRFQFDLSGSQRSAAVDEIGAFGVFSGATNLASVAYQVGAESGTVGSINGVTSISVIDTSLPGAFSWTTSFVEFVAASAGSVRFGLRTGSADNVGPLIDNVLITRTPATVVPEPSTYALLATGFVGLAVAARRRRA